MAKKKCQVYDLFEIRWHGRGHVLMSRNFCTDRNGIQKYINGVFDRIKRFHDHSADVRGSTPDLFIVINSDRSGVEIRKVKEARWPYNRLTDNFDEVQFIYAYPFISMLDEDGLREFAKQEKERLV